MEKVAKNGRKVKAIALLFLPILAPFSKIEKGAKNRRKVKAIALLFLPILAPFSKIEERLKMDELRLYSLTFLPILLCLLKSFSDAYQHTM
jgi:hypothetical protein